jgi:LysM repeat protein
MLDKQSMLQDDLRIQTTEIAHRLNRIEIATTKRLDDNTQCIIDTLNQMQRNSYATEGVSRAILQPEEQEVQCTEFYFVVSGDSCSALGAKYGFTVDQFIAWNPVVASSCNIWLSEWYCIGV